MDFKEALRMITSRTNIGSLCADDDMTAVAALLYLDLALFKYLSSFNIVEQCTVSFLMMFFDCRNKFEFCRELGESFFLGSFGKALVHIGPLVVLTVRGRRSALRSL